MDAEFHKRGAVGMMTRLLVIIALLLAAVSANAAMYLRAHGGLLGPTPPSNCLLIGGTTTDCLLVGGSTTNVLLVR